MKLIGTLIKWLLFLCFWPITLPVWLINRSKKKASSNQIQTSNIQPTTIPQQTTAQTVPNDIGLANFTVNIQTNRAVIPTESKAVCKDFSFIDFGKPAGSIDRFVNFSEFKVSGKNNNSKTVYRTVQALSEQDAIQRCLQEGLKQPLSAKLIATPEATERQIDYLRDMDICFPEEINKYVASDIISRAVGEDSIESPRPWLISLANNLHICYTSYIGHDGLFRKTVMHSGAKNNAALYAYAVDQNVHGQPFGNMFDVPYYNKYYSFAELIQSDASLMKSLAGRNSDDFLNPQKNTNIYKAAVKFLVDNHA